MVEVGQVCFGGGRLCLIAGPCAIEDNDTALVTARALAALPMPVVFKASFDKANRTSGKSPRGVGLEQGLEVLAAIRRDTGLPVTTDVHDVGQVEAVAEVVDLLQVPAFLCRQTDLLEACARSGRPVNVKKGQFLAPLDMRHVVDKLRGAGAAGVMVTERGTTFGYGDLVVDYRSLVWMRAFGVPVVFDATHTTQTPGTAGGQSGGDRTLAPALGRAAVAVGVDAVFAEVHPDPDRAWSDAASQIALDGFPAIAEQWRVLDAALRGDRV